MFLDPNCLEKATPQQILFSAAQGHLGLDRRFLKSLIDRREQALPVLVDFAKRDRSQDVIDLEPEIIGLLRHWKAPEAVPILIGMIRADPENVPDEVTEALVELGASALEPLIALYSELPEEQSGDIAFILANLRIPDPRVLQLLTSRLEFDLSDTLMLLGIYGDPAALASLSDHLAGDDDQLKSEMEDVRGTLSSGAAAEPPEFIEFDVLAEYPAEADVPVDMLDDDERLELLTHPIEAVRAAAAASFFNRELTENQRRAILEVAGQDTSPSVRARAWEALNTVTEDSEVVEAMLSRLRSQTVAPDELGGLLVGLSGETDRNEVRKALEDAYKDPPTRAKALEAMWRSMHASFRERFAKHLDDSDLETKRAAVWGVGYYGVRSELDKLRRLFDNPDLRSDALFAYTLALPGEVSRGRINGMLARVEKDAKGLSEMEEDLVKVALDEKLMLAGKDPVFAQQED